LSPTFHKSEDYKARGWLLTFFFLFVFAGFFTFIFVLPFLSKFLLLFEIQMNGFTIELQPRMVSYVNWLQSVFLFTVLFFQLPLVFSLLFYYSTLKSSALCKNRKAIFFVLLLLAAFVSPPDLVMESLILSLFFLFAEIIIWIGFLFEKNF
jgi:sec-independent protein translocase protein TatC